MEVNNFYINDIPVYFSKTEKFKTINLQIIFLSDGEWNPYAFLTGNDIMQIWLIINP